MAYSLNQSVRPARAARQEEGLRQLTLVIYLLYGLSLFTAMPALIALLLNYLRLSESRGTIYHSHLRWMLRSFWWGTVWAALGLGALALGLSSALSSGLNDYVQADLRQQAQTFAAAGMIMLAFNWIWLLSRVMRGLLYWNEHRRMWA